MLAVHGTHMCGGEFRSNSCGGDEERTLAGTPEDLAGEVGAAESRLRNAYDRYLPLKRFVKMRAQARGMCCIEPNIGVDDEILDRWQRIDHGEQTRQFPEKELSGFIGFHMGNGQHHLFNGAVTGPVAKDNAGCACPNIAIVHIEACNHGREGEYDEMGRDASTICHA